MLATGGLMGTDLFLDEASVTRTENAIMLASPRARPRSETPRASPTFRISQFVTSAAIAGIGTNALRIEGVQLLRGGEWRIGTDYIEVGSFIGLCAMTEGEMVIEDVDSTHLIGIGLGFGRLGVSLEARRRHLRSRRPRARGQARLHGASPAIQDGPWPASRRT